MIKEPAYIDDEGVIKLTHALFTGAVKEYQADIKALKKLKKGSKEYATAYINARDIRAFFGSKWAGAIYPLDDPTNLTITLDQIDKANGWKSLKEAETMHERINKLIKKQNPPPDRLKHLLRYNPAYDYRLGRFWYDYISWREAKALAGLLETTTDYIIFGR